VKEVENNINFCNFIQRCNRLFYMRYGGAERNHGGARRIRPLLKAKLKHFHITKVLIIQKFSILNNPKYVENLQK